MYMLHTAVWEVWVGASLCVKLHFCHGCSCDSHFYVEPIVDNVTCNSLGTCTTISCRTSPSPRSDFWISISTHHPQDLLSSCTLIQRQQRLQRLHCSPPRCEYHCRWCTEPCSRLPGQRKHHSCWEHRHRR